MTDAQGVKWLDAGVSHALVGHANPHVAEVVARQMRVPVWTEARERLRAEYSARFLKLFPPEFSVVYLVHSSSEACELALRLARAHRPGKDVVVLEDADYGMTTSLANMSPARFAVRGSGKKFWVQVASRGLASGSDAADVAAKVRTIEAGGRGVCGFFAEGVFADGFLREAYASVRAAGGLNVAIEGQTGMGRVGEAFWEFARAGASPDIVVAGESMANGLPMAAVVTRRELAAPFDVGDGAGAVECAAAGAVLDVLQVPKLDLGMDGLRGSGLCYEIDVPDASQVAARLRERRILIRARGDTLLFRPPLTFSPEEASQFVEGLQACV